MNSRSPLLLVMVERIPESKDILARLARSQLSARAAACLSASAFFLAVSASSAAFFLASSSFSLPALGSFFAVGLALLFSFTVLPSVFASDFASEGVALSVGLMVSRLAGTVVFLGCCTTFLAGTLAGGGWSL